jgi:hypothetical protein
MRVASNAVELTASGRLYHAGPLSLVEEASVVERDDALEVELGQDAQRVVR